MRLLSPISPACADLTPVSTCCCSGMRVIHERAGKGSKVVWMAPGPGKEA